MHINYLVHKNHNWRVRDLSSIPTLIPHAPQAQGQICHSIFFYLYILRKRRLMASEILKPATSFCYVLLLLLKDQKMNTKPSLSQTKILAFATQLNDTRTRYGRSSISATLSSKPIYSRELKATKETTRIEPSNKKNASNEDDFFSKIAINYLSKTLQDTSGSCLTSIL